MTNDDQDLPKLFLYVPKYTGTCDLFGGNQIVVNVMTWPNRWVRFWSKVFFNSKWTINKEDS